MASLEEVYLANSFGDLLSRADFWAYTGILALKKAVGVNNRNCDTDETDCTVVSPGMKVGKYSCIKAALVISYICYFLLKSKLYRFKGPKLVGKLLWMLVLV